jgi:hypothetical protein
MSDRFRSNGGNLLPDHFADFITAAGIDDNDTAVCHDKSRVVVKTVTDIRVFIVRAMFDDIGVWCYFQRLDVGPLESVGRLKGKAKDGEQIK